MFKLCVSSFLLFGLCLACSSNPDAADGTSGTASGGGLSSSAGGSETVESSGAGAPSVASPGGGGALGSGGSSQTGTGGVDSVGGAGTGSPAESGGSGGDAAGGAPAGSGGEAMGGAPAGAGGQAAGGSGGSAGMRGGTALLVTRPSKPSVGDAALQKRLEGLGFDVTLVTDTEPAMPGMFTVIVISEASESKAVADKYNNNPAPIVSGEPHSLDFFGIGAGEKASGTAIQIDDAAHPIAAGLKGTVQIYTGSGKIAYGAQLAASVTPVASVPGASDSIALIAVEKGAALNGGGTAPNRRVHWFLEDEYTNLMTPDAWKIFDACVEWATGQP